MATAMTKQGIMADLYLIDTVFRNHFLVVACFFSTSIFIIYHYYHYLFVKSKICVPERQAEDDVGRRARTTRVRHVLR